MANFKVEFSEQELIQIIGAYVAKEYNIDARDYPLTLQWSGSTPSGAAVFTQPIMSRTKPFED